MAPKTISVADLPGLAGSELGVSDWHEVTQSRIDTFADATDDHQWIHIDPERAAAGPFGAPVAHGFLTLSLFVPLLGEILAYSDATTFVNYGLDRVRFVSPVRAGSRVRLRAALRTVTEVPGGYQILIDGTIELEGSEKPAVAIESISRVYG